MQNILEPQVYLNGQVSIDGNKRGRTGMLRAADPTVSLDVVLIGKVVDMSMSTENGKENLWSGHERHGFKHRR
jgi:hypothetical protein